MASWEQIFLFSESVGKKLLEENLYLSSAESCTGGGIGYAITQVPGSSQWYVGGFNAYSNQIKQTLLGIDQQLLVDGGAVSEPVVAMMAENTARLMHADVAISTSGIAGPDGGTEEKPVGTVCFGWVTSGFTHAETLLLKGDRESIRMQSIEYSLKTLLERL